MRIASRLIESILLNVPIPTMFFHETANGVLEVVDGKQRLTSIWSYMEEKFPDGTEFKLQGLEVCPIFHPVPLTAALGARITSCGGLWRARCRHPPPHTFPPALWARAHPLGGPVTAGAGVPRAQVYDEINDKKFSDLTEQQQETIKDYALNVHTISRHCEPDFVFEVFERLNMGATQLNEQELRNCIYQVPPPRLAAPRRWRAAPRRLRRSGADWAPPPPPRPRRAHTPTSWGTSRATRTCSRYTSPTRRTSA